MNIVICCLRERKQKRGKNCRGKCEPKTDASEPDARFLRTRKTSANVLFLRICPPTPFRLFSFGERYPKPGDGQKWRQEKLRGKKIVETSKGSFVLFQHSVKHTRAVCAPTTAATGKFFRRLYANFPVLLLLSRIFRTPIRIVVRFSSCVRLWVKWLRRRSVNENMKGISIAALPRVSRRCFSKFSEIAHAIEFYRYRISIKFSDHP